MRGCRLSREYDGKVVALGIEDFLSESRLCSGKSCPGTQVAAQYFRALMERAGATAPARLHGRLPRVRLPSHRGEINEDKAN